MIELISRLLADQHEFVEVAFWGSIAALVCTFFLLNWLVWLRMKTYRDKRIMDDVQASWEPVFRAMRNAVPVSKPDIYPEQAPAFLLLWLEQMEYAPPAYQKDLRVLSSVKQLETVILELLSTHPVPLFAPPASQVALAIRAARYIDTPEIRQRLRTLVDSDNQGFAIQACETLMALKDRHAVRLVLDLLFRFPEQDRYLATRLGVAGGEQLVHVLDPFLEKLPNARLEDIIFLIGKSDDSTLLPILERLFARPGSDEELASLLRAMSSIGTSAQRDLVVPHLDSEASFVRLQAAAALGSIGRPEDVQLLLPMLSDPDWWVRYRAAQACYRLMKQPVEEMQALADSQRDPYARDILRHVRSEMQWFTS